MGNTPSSGCAWGELNGSSPRAWGTPGLDGLAGRAGRFIPTCMGNTVTTSSGPMARTVHPHVHGTRVRFASGGASRRSSPRAWGTLVDVEVVRLRIRFIPTHMGNATTDMMPVIVRRSSPFTWGTRHADRDTRSGGRFIPTLHGERELLLRHRELRCRFILIYMGNAIELAVEPGQVAVHPHAWGTHAC